MKGGGGRERGREKKQLPRWNVLYTSARPVLLSSSLVDAIGEGGKEEEEVQLCAKQKGEQSQQNARPSVNKGPNGKSPECPVLRWSCTHSTRRAYVAYRYTYSIYIHTQIYKMRNKTTTRPPNTNKGPGGGRRRKQNESGEEEEKKNH